MRLSTQAHHPYRAGALRPINPVPNGLVWVRMGEGRTDRPGPYQQRLSVRDAAVALGISEGAVRMRVKRGTLPSTREGGRLYVLLHADPTPEPERDNDRTDELIATLRGQLEAERQAHAEARRLLMAALERIPPQIEAPQEAPGGPETDAEEQSSAQRPSEAREGAQRPWWRRMFGGD
jgi:hypothetical protein